MYTRNSLTANEAAIASKLCSYNGSKRLPTHHRVTTQESHAPARSRPCYNARHVLQRFLWSKRWW
jgi:hypothetical protein